MTTTKPLGAIEETIPLPADLGYPEGSAVTIRVNPTKAQWDLWNRANDPPPETATDAERKAHAAERPRLMAQALHALYRGTILPGFDFSSEAAAKATWERTDVPDELWLFLLQLPWKVVADRRERILKNVIGSSALPNSTTD